MKTKQTYNEFLQRIIGFYQENHPGQQWTMDDVASWAIENGHYVPDQRDIAKMFRRQLSRAARSKYFQDPQGREVRRLHPRRVSVEENGRMVQRTFWDDMFTAPPEHMKVSFQQRRTGILYDCKQLKTDNDSYNENNDYGTQLLLNFDFRDDLIEMDESTEYPDAPPGYDPELDD